jgi:DNA transposition AAA+ family ATPase
VCQNQINRPFTTPYVGITARQLFYEIQHRVSRLSVDIERLHRPDFDPELNWDREDPCRTELVIIDEADRLKTNGLEQLRDYFDRSDLGVILIGMPGFDRQLARYPQLYSRIGFAHQYKPLDPEDIPIVLKHYWQQLSLPDTDVNPDNEAVSTIISITGGNFRLIERLMTQVGRPMAINNFDDIGPDLITAARQTLVIGTQ